MAEHLRRHSLRRDKPGRAHSFASCLIAGSYVIHHGSTVNPPLPLQYQRNHSSNDLENPLINVNGNPSVILINPPLTCSAYDNSWCISMHIALEVKNKWCIIDDTVSVPNRDHPQYAAWRRCNLMVCFGIFKSVHSSIAQGIMHLDKAKDVWENLKRQFSQRDAQKISSLQNEIFNLKQDTLSVNDYYTRCCTLEEMNALRPLLVCKCDPKCSCDLIDEIRKDRGTDRVIRFLQGLNEDYDNLKSNVLDPLPEVYKIFAMAEKLERHIALDNLNISNLDLVKQMMFNTTKTSLMKS